MYDFVIKLASKFYDLVKNAQDVIQSRELIVDDEHFAEPILACLLLRNEKYNIGLSISKKDLMSYIKTNINRLNEELSDSNKLDERMTLFQMLDCLRNGRVTMMAHNDPYVEGNVLLEFGFIFGEERARHSYDNNEQLFSLLRVLLFMEGTNVRGFADRTVDTMLPETPRNEPGLLETLR